MVRSSQRGLRLSSRARLVLAVLVDHADVEGVARPGYRRMAFLTGINKNAIRGVLDELERAGRIEVLQRGPSGSRYRVADPAGDRGSEKHDSARGRRAHLSALGGIGRATAVRRVLLGLLGFAVAAGAVGASLHSASFLYLLYTGISLLLGVIAWTTLLWMLHAWRTPASLDKSAMSGDELQPRHSFSLIVPARHEEAVLEATLSRLVSAEHPAFEVLVVVGADDPATREVAERVRDCHPELVKVIVDASWPKNKPKALNAALPECRGAITGVFDAEDDVHPALLRRVDACFQRTDADVVQAGVQLMNFRSSWLTVRNVLEYYFWFRSRLHFHARQGFIPLGGNTVFVRTPILQAVSGWDPECLAEDCELGVRLSSLGAQTVVFYEPELVTREECPPTLGAFARQRTRWNQGYLQTLSKGYWRRLPLRQRTLGVYTLAMPCLMALVWVLMPVALATAILVKAPVPITLVSFLPAVPMLSMLAVEVAGLGEFCRAYGERATMRDYGRLVVGLPFYQAVLAFAAARAVAREARGNRGWEKTAHTGLHLAQPVDAQSERTDAPLGAPSPRPARALTPSLVGSNGAVGAQIDSPTFALMPGDLASGARNRRESPPYRIGDDLLRRIGGEPLWARVAAMSANGSGSLALPGIAPVGRWGARRRRRRDLRASLRSVAASRPDVLVQVGLLAAVGFVQATNMLHWPASQFDEGTYMGNAWAVQHGALAPYTYSYGHPPLCWLLIALWTAVTGIFGGASYSIDAGRGFMFVVSIISCSLLYTLARRLGMGRPFAAAAVVLFALCPVSLFFHRAVLLDNPAIAWALAAFVLALTPRRRLWAFAASGACFAACVLCKETTLVLLPALFVAAAQNSDQRTRRYCLTLFFSFLGLVAAAYPLYATLKGELLPGPGHVSLAGYTLYQLFGRETSGSIFDPHSAAHATVVAWLHTDPWLLGAALVVSPVALARRNTRAVALAFVIQVWMILRPGYLPGMYVLGLLPFAALVVVGVAEALWRTPGLTGSRLLAWPTRAAIAALAAVVVLAVAPRWAHSDRVATTARPDAPHRAAERWIVANIGRDKRLIVDDEFWIYLIQHGFDHRPVRGGFFSRTVVSFWPLDYDPAVKRQFPGGWRDFDYVVSTEPMRGTTDRTPEATAALRHSRLIVQFGRGTQRLEIREITGA